MARLRPRQARGMAGLGTSRGSDSRAEMALLGLFPAPWRDHLLLDRPLCRRARGEVEVNDATALVAEDHEAEKSSEGRRGMGAEAEPHAPLPRLRLSGRHAGM